MYAKQFVSFMERHSISSPGQWERATNGRVSKSTITRGLKGEGKDVGVLREMIAMLNTKLEAKNTWIKNSFKICMVLLLIIFAMTIIDGVLISSLIQVLNP